MHHGGDLVQVLKRRQPQLDEPRFAERIELIEQLSDIEVNELLGTLSGKD